MLTIAGSDSGGGAGIQADLKTFAALDVFGTAAITCLTAQNPREIKAVQPVVPKMVIRQIRAVCDYFPVAAVKTGMLYNDKIVLAVADEIKRGKFPIVVVDPVCRATSGRSLLTNNAFRILCSKLLPLATVITPNVPEAEMILNCRINNHADQRAAAFKLSKKFKSACIIKGGHLPGNEAVDVLYYRNRLYSFKARRLNVKKLHGAGCVFSSALTASLARGMNMKNAVVNAKKYVFQLIQTKKSIDFRPLRTVKRTSRIGVSGYRSIGDF